MDYTYYIRTNTYNIQINTYIYEILLSRRVYQWGPAALQLLLLVFVLFGFKPIPKPRPRIADLQDLQVPEGEAELACPISPQECF